LREGLERGNVMSFKIVFLFVNKQYWQHCSEWTW
jgi:hypothetical protein